uniref:hypothetical protein n=1 Tax=Phymatolithon calcareum TaxID=1277942 RepID=UPI0023EF8D4A|nr:hypothetical protein P6G74_pgp077 [Phymatolithon calcareum]WEA76801.1 hypothetical protein [Phymatolithon calcareum]
MNFKKVKQPVYLHNRIANIAVSEIVYINQNNVFKKNIKTIIFKGINNQNLKNKLFRYLNISDIFKLTKKLTFNDLNYIVNKLRYSGFFKQIKASHLAFKNKPYLVIQLYLNPILKEIVIRNANDLKIPLSYLNSIIKKQVGYPKSLKFIYKMIQTIQSWYFIRGYKWIKISCKTPSLNLNKIELEILESKIGEIEIICINNMDKLYKKDLRSCILNELQIFPGQSLNFYKIELGIIKLRAQKLILNCNYEIQYINKNTLKIIIKYRCLEEKISYFFNRSIYFPYYLFDFIYNEAYIAFNYLLKNFNNSVHWKKIINTYINLQIYTSCSISNNTNYYNLILSNFLQIRDVLQNSYKEDTFILLKNNLRFKHYANNFNPILTNFILDIQKYQDKTEFIISYKYPKLVHRRYCESKFLISIFQKLYKFKNSIFKVVFEQVNHKRILFTSYYNSYGTEMTFIKNLSSNLYIFNHLSILQDVYQVHTLYYKNSWITFYNFFKLTNNKLKNKFCTINQKFIYHMIDIKSDILNFKTRLIPSDLWKFSIRSYTPFIVDFQQFNKRERINYLINTKYIKIVKFNTNIFNFLVNTAILNIQIKTFLGKIQQMPTKLLNVLKDWQVTQNTNIDSKIKIYQYFHLDLEYHIYKKYNMCLFIFFDYRQYFNYSDFDYTSCRIYKTRKGIYLFGTGLQINLPIKQMPIVKVKYEINANDICRLYTKLYFK